jgi:hypothetical protein
VDAESDEHAYIRPAWHGYWIMTVTVGARTTVASGRDPGVAGEAGQGVARDERRSGARDEPPFCDVTVDGDYSSRLAHIAANWLLKDERERALGFLRDLQAWGIEPRP